MKHFYVPDTGRYNLVRKVSYYVIIIIIALLYSAYYVPGKVLFLLSHLWWWDNNNYEMVTIFIPDFTDKKSERPGNWWKFYRKQNIRLQAFNLKSVLFWPPKKLEYHNEKMTNSLIMRKKVNENKMNLIL